MTKMIMGAIDAAVVGVILLGTASVAVEAEPLAVIELFTSQGCSSCPAADKLLSELRDDPNLITLSLPIDYWDYLGWKDTLAMPGHTARQKAYAVARGDSHVYTPQTVIDGLVDLTGYIPAAIGYLMRGLQVGLVQFYALAMVLGMIVLVAARLLWAG